MGNQRLPSVGMDASGDFTVVWSGYGDSSGHRPTRESSCRPTTRKARRPGRSSPAVRRHQRPARPPRAQWRGARGPGDQLRVHLQRAVEHHRGRGRLQQRGEPQQLDDYPKQHANARRHRLDSADQRRRARPIRIPGHVQPEAHRGNLFPLDLGQRRRHLRQSPGRQLRRPAGRRLFPRFQHPDDQQRRQPNPNSPNSPGGGVISPPGARVPPTFR